MNIEFIKMDQLLIMIYQPDFGIEEIRRKLDSGEGINLKNCFHLKTENEYQLPEQDAEHNPDRFLFRVGLLIGDYYKLDKEIFGTENDFYIAKDIPVAPKLFVAYRGISILRNIDKLASEDVYIAEDGTDDLPGCLPYSEFLTLIKQFPNTTELDKYSRARIALVLKNYFDGLGDFSLKYENYLDKRITTEAPSKMLELRPLQWVVFHNAIEMMQEMLAQPEAYSESQWQELVCEIIRIVYPKYIVAKREQSIGTDGRHNKKPDFVLVDSGGFVDVLEIKKPNGQRLLTKTEYRNNYVADRDLSGAILQIEKYVYCLSHNSKSLEELLQKRLKQELPPGFKIHITNPQGMLLMGRSNELTKDQVFDLEIIKRQHKNIVDLMTYDDLMNRLSNIIERLSAK